MLKKNYYINSKQLWLYFFISIIHLLNFLSCTSEKSIQIKNSSYTDKPDMMIQFPELFNKKSTFYDSKKYEIKLKGNKSNHIQFIEGEQINTICIELTERVYRVDMKISGDRLVPFNGRDKILLKDTSIFDRNRSLLFVRSPGEVVLIQIRDGDRNISYPDSILGFSGILLYPFGFFPIFHRYIDYELKFLRKEEITEEMIKKCDKI